MRDEQRRLVLNPVTGKLEDIAPAKVDARKYSSGGNLIVCDPTGDEIWTRCSPLLFCRMVKSSAENVADIRSTSWVASK